MHRKLSAPVVYLIMAGASSLFFALVFNVNMIYQATTVKLNPLQLVLVGTLLETVCFIFEIPTGVVADGYSRRLSVIIGFFLTGLGFIVEGSIPLFAAVLASQVIWGIGATFNSGAGDAWIADEMNNQNMEQTFLKGAQVGQFAAFIGIFISVGLGSLALQLPIILGGSLFIALAVFLIFTMPEDHFIPSAPEDKNSWQNMGHTLASGIQILKKSPILLTILGIGLFYGLSSEGFDRLWTVHFLQDFQFPQFWNLKPVIWFGLMNSISMLLSIMILEFIKRHLEKTGKLRMVWVLFSINALLIAGFVVFGLAGNFTIALMAYWSSSILRTANGPIYSAWINQHISESSVRATLLSMSNQVDALGQIIGGPIIGFIASLASVSIGIMSAGLIMIPILFIYLGAIGLSKKSNHQIKDEV